MLVLLCIPISQIFQRVRRNDDSHKGVGVRRKDGGHGFLVQVSVQDEGFVEAWSRLRCRLAGRLWWPEPRLERRDLALRVRPGTHGAVVGGLETLP